MKLLCCQVLNVPYQSLYGTSEFYLGKPIRALTGNEELKVEDINRDVLSRVETKAMLEIIIAQSHVPVIVDAGIGAPSDAALAFELGADAVMVNTAIAASRDPVAMSHAFKLAQEAGRTAFEAGLAVKAQSAVATSPMEAFLKEAMK